VARVREQVRARFLLQKVELGVPIRVTPMVANDVLYMTTEHAADAINSK
jgi:hypothetical protein